MASLPSNVVLAAMLLSWIIRSVHSASHPSFLFMLGDDIGWADFSYNNGTANSPNIDAWAKEDGSILMQDFHTGGTVCSPTRATVLTGRNHFRDCVNYVYGCSDMTECVPKFDFAPQRTFTIADAARAANKGYKSWFGGKWHLGSFYNDSEQFGGRTSSPISHGFDHMNATVEVAPTSTLNCQCNNDWYGDCNFGHYHGSNHCSGGPNPGGPPLKNGCCFNYWWESNDAPHGVTNLTKKTGLDDAAYLADSFIRFAESRDGEPFLAQISFHNCHIPYIGAPNDKAACNSSKTCRALETGAKPFSDAELDFYACVNEFDSAVGKVIAALKRLKYYDNTLIFWSGGDNGPEVNCPPEGRCKGTINRPGQAPGSAGPLRGRKRDVWEGGHRVPGIISWPAIVKGPARISWDTVVTMDFLVTVMDVLGVQRPSAQTRWAMDGLSVMPILRGQGWPLRGIGWIYDRPVARPENGYGYRYGKWKLAVGGISCKSVNCSRPQLYDLDSDIGEYNDLSASFPDVMVDIQANFTRWFNSIHNSITHESKCSGHPPAPSPTPVPPSPRPSSQCTFLNHTALSGQNIATGHVESKEACCGACIAHEGCAASDFVRATPMHPSWDGEMVGGTCHLKSRFEPKAEGSGMSQTACHPLDAGGPSSLTFSV